jgi:hypothetical protein
MFEPKPSHPKWLLFLYPYYVLVRCFPKMIIPTLLGKTTFHYHYSWEKEDSEIKEKKI